MEFVPMWTTSGPLIATTAVEVGAKHRTTAVHLKESLRVDLVEPFDPSRGRALLTLHRGWTPIGHIAA
eukprot:5544777-Amphidinium_carterae.2